MNYNESFESHLREQGKAEKIIQSYTGGIGDFSNTWNQRNYHLMAFSFIKTL